MTDEQCTACGKVSELRPYGKKGARICFDCMKLNEPAAKKIFSDTLSAAGPFAVLTEGGVRPGTQEDIDAIQRVLDAGGLH